MERWERTRKFESLVFGITIRNSSISHATKTLHPWKKKGREEEVRSSSSMTKNVSGLGHEWCLSPKASRASRLSDHDRIQEAPSNDCSGEGRVES